MVAAHTEQLKKGLTAEQVKFTTSVPVLRDASVKPIVDLYEWAQTQAGQDLIKRVR
jgi:TRAP-type C4-dicarboxylate transport system substrate-binding protein